MVVGGMLLVMLLYLRANRVHDIMQMARAYALLAIWGLSSQLVASHRTHGISVVQHYPA